MKLSLDGLERVCLSNVVEIKFNRRLRVVGKPATRRMLATKDVELLNSKEGLKILNFKAPMQSPPYNAASKGLLTVWDILFQDWRNIPVNAATVVSMIPTKPTAEKFWEYFNNVLVKMTAIQKAAFMDK